MSGISGADFPTPPGGFFPAVYDELRRLAAARKGKGGHKSPTTATGHWYLHRVRIIGV